MPGNNEVASLQEYKDRKTGKPQKEIPVIREWTGDFKVRFRGILLNVRALRPEDVSELFGHIKQPAETKETMVKTDIDTHLNGNPTEEEIKESGERAKQTISETASGIKGLPEIIDFFKQCANPNSLTDATDFDLVVIKPESQEYAEYKYESELKGPELNRSPIYQDITNEGIQIAFMVTRAKGDEFIKIMENGGHKIYKHPSGTGFQAEINGFRMAFLFPPEEKITLEQDDKKMIAKNDNATPQEQAAEDVAA